MRTWLECGVVIEIGSHGISRLYRSAQHRVAVATTRHVDEHSLNQGAAGHCDVMKILSCTCRLIWSSVSWAELTSPQQVGEVGFANSGAAAAQAEFLRGLAQLHNFEYDDAAAHFREAQKIDPSFAMANWGEAMTKNHGIWHEQDRSAALQVLGRLGATPAARQAKAPTEREKLYSGA